MTATVIIAAIFFRFGFPKELSYQKKNGYAK